VAKGSVYAIIGIFALLESLGAGGETLDPAGVMQSVGSAGSEAFGGILLVLLALGLACYALWKLVQGVTDPDGKGSDAHGMLRRVGYVGSAAIHGVLAYTAAQSVFGAEDTSEDAMTASAMAYGPLGRIFVGVVGLIVIGVGLYQLYAAYTAKFRGDLELHGMSDAEQRWVTLAGRAGTAARAVAIGVAGAFVILAAYQADADEVRGLGEALELLQHQPLGSYMLAIMAVGLIVYGAFMFAIARYRRIEPADPSGPS
jgi:heme/copper-type cytochrome/quinol oxidase subunit 2